MLLIARFVATALVGLALLPTAAAQEGRAASHYDLDGGLALEGYDPVAYFEVGAGQAVKGKADLTVEHGGVTYRFANEKNKRTFEAAPELYEPAYGGWCAYAMSKGKKVAVKPTIFRIGEGRLLLFSDTDYLEFDDDWVPDEHALLKKADAKWKELTGESPRPGPAGTSRSISGWNLSDECLAMEGWDPVSYFPEGGGTPKEGKKQYTMHFRGVNYRFANAENLQTFRADPTRFEPQHGNWCSYAMGARDKLVEVDPEAYRLQSGQLHLFYVSWFDDTREPWDEDPAGIKKKADANWLKRQAAMDQGK